MLWSSSSDEDEPLRLRARPMTVDDLSERDIENVNEQMVREIFRLAGRKPTDHASCFQACVQMVKDTDVIHATDFKEWEKHQYIQAGLDSLKSAQDAAGPAAVWMINAPVAVAAAAALNIPRMRIQRDSQLTSAFIQNSLWSWVGCAIDFSLKLSGPILSAVPRGSMVNLLHPNTDNSALAQPTISPLQSITLPLFVHLRISQIGIPVREQWFQAEMTSTVVTTRREEAMEKGKTVLTKLGNELHDQAALREPINEWLSKGIIHVLPKNVKDKLWTWSLQHHSHWQTHIAQASEDLTEHYDVAHYSKIFARLASHGLRRRLDQAQCLVHVLGDEGSSDNLEKLVRRMRQPNRDELSVFLDVIKLQRLMIDGLISAPSPVPPVVQSPQNRPLAGPKYEHDRIAFVRVIQKILDASICLTPKCPALVDTWLVLVSVMDYTLLSSFCFDADKARERRGVAKKHPRDKALDDEEFSKMATTINKTDPESQLMAYTIFRIHMPQILSEKDLVPLGRYLESPKPVIVVWRGRMKRRRDSESES